MGLKDLFGFKKRSDKEISAEELKSLKDNGEEVFVLDVREPYEFDEVNMGGHLIPLGELPMKLDELSDKKEVFIVVHCRSGMRSAMAQEVLTGAGFQDVWNLTGGILAWEELK